MFIIIVVCGITPGSGTKNRRGAVKMQHPFIVAVVPNLANAAAVVLNITKILSRIVLLEQSRHGV